MGREFQDDDNLIDWSAFDENEQTLGELEGSRQLRIVSLVVLLIAIAGIVVGGMDFNTALNRVALSSNSESAFFSNFDSFAKPCFLIFFGLLTIIPASFGFQTAKSPVVFVAPTVLGLAGIAFSVLCAIGTLVMDALSGSFEPLMPTYFLVCAVAAVGYLFFVVRVHKAANAAGGTPVRKRPTKEELWDEKNIWQ